MLHKLKVFCDLRLDEVIYDSTFKIKLKSIQREEEEESSAVLFRYTNAEAGTHSRDRKKLIVGMR